MTDGEAPEDKEYPLWGRMILAIICLVGSALVGWTAGGVGGAIAGGILGIVPAFLAIAAPGVLMGIFLVLEILSSCS